jgi:hypothetical protein
MAKFALLTVLVLRKFAFACKVSFSLEQAALRAALKIAQGEGPAAVAGSAHVFLDNLEVTVLQE